MPILIRDEHFETKVEAERAKRRQKTNSKTLTQLAEERLVELQTGEFLPPVQMPDDSDVESSAEPSMS